MTVNALAFYAVAVLIVLAAAAAVGLPSLRLRGLRRSSGGAARGLDIVSGAYALAVIQLVVPGIAVGIVVLVLRHEQYRGLAAVRQRPGDGWIAGPGCAGLSAVLVVTLSIVGSALVSGTHWRAASEVQPGRH